MKIRSILSRWREFFSLRISRLSLASAPQFQQLVLWCEPPGDRRRLRVSFANPVNAGPRTFPVTDPPTGTSTEWFPTGDGTAAAKVAGGWRVEILGDAVAKVEFAGQVSPTTRRLVIPRDLPSDLRDLSEPLSLPQISIVGDLSQAVSSNLRLGEDEGTFVAAELQFDRKDTIERHQIGNLCAEFERPVTDGSLPTVARFVEDELQPALLAYRSALGESLTGKVDVCFHDDHARASVDRPVSIVLPSVPATNRLEILVWELSKLRWNSLSRIHGADALELVFFLQSMSTLLMLESLDLQRMPRGDRSGFGGNTSKGGHWRNRNPAFIRATAKLDRWRETYRRHPVVLRELARDLLGKEVAASWIRARLSAAELIV